MASAGASSHRVGILADPQVRVPPASLEDSECWSGTVRRYSAVLGHVRAAAEEFRRQNVAWVMQLGDLVDNANARTKPPCSEGALAAVEAELAHCHEGGQARIHHIIGNNDIQNFCRRDWSSYEWAQRARRLVGKGVVEGGAYTHYYDFKPFEGLRWRFVVLDSYVVNIVPNGECNEEEAMAMIRAPDTGSVGCVDLAPDASVAECRNSLFGQSYNRLGVDNPRRRFTWGNGGFGRDQLAWLRGVLEEARAGGENVIIFAHNPIHPRVVNDPDGLAYDYAELLEVIAEFKDLVVAYLAGHDHIGGYTFDLDTGVHHLTVPSPLEAEPGTGSRFLVMDLDNERVWLKGSAAVVVDPVQRAFVEKRAESDGEDIDGKQRARQAQLGYRSLNFGNHWGVVWPGKD